MTNLTMQTMLKGGECLDVEAIGRLVTAEEVQAGAAPALAEGTYRLAHYVDDVDYCIASSERWIWSIGRERATGAIYASTDCRFYEQMGAGFECLWLR